MILYLGQFLVQEPDPSLVLSCISLFYLLPQLLRVAHARIQLAMRRVHEATEHTSRLGRFQFPLLSGSTLTGSYSLSTKSSSASSRGRMGGHILTRLIQGF